MVEYSSWGCIDSTGKAHNNFKPSRSQVS